MNHTSGSTATETALPWFASAPEPKRTTAVWVREYEDPAADLRGGWGLRESARERLTRM
jgi:hypothetical protein